MKNGRPQDWGFVEFWGEDEAEKIKSQRLHSSRKTNSNCSLYFRSPSDQSLPETLQGRGKIFILTGLTGSSPSSREGNGAVILRKLKKK